MPLENFIEEKKLDFTHQLIYVQYFDHFSNENIRLTIEEIKQKLNQPIILQSFGKLIEENERYLVIQNLFPLKIDFIVKSCVLSQKKYVEIEDTNNNILQQRDYIERELQKYGFTTVLKDYKEVNELYQNNRRGPIGLLRVTYEGLIRGLVTKLDGTSNSVNSNLLYLEKKGILKETSVNYPEPKLELNFSIKLYGLLSHYGSHPNEADEDIISTLFLEATIWIYFILKRFELQFNSSL